MTNVWHRLANEDYGHRPATTAEAKAKAVETVLEAARGCKVFRNTATTPELKALLTAIDALDTLGVVSDHPLHCPCPTCAKAGE